MAAATDVIIRPFVAGDGAAFAALNIQWLSAMFVVEDADRRTLANVEESIIHPGGAILMAVEPDGTAVGCCALVAISVGVYELGKMAVDESRRGRGIGRRILESIIALARARGATTLYLGSHTRLANAVHLYHALGFRTVPAADTPLHIYERSDIWMRLDL